MFLACAPGLEGVLAEEARGLGLTKVTPREGGVDANGDATKAAHHLRTCVCIDQGPPLYARGYREEIGKAPMRETLAAGVLLLGGYTGREPLWDVMVGSGTLLIEGAWMAMGVAPGTLRARQPVTGPKPPPLLGSDLNSGQLGVTRRNAKRAGVHEHLILERMDAAKLTARPGSPALKAGSPAIPDPVMAAPGLVVANLPYGIRVGEKSELGALYSALGASLLRVVPGWRFAFLLQEGEDRLGLPIAATTEVNNGGIRCRVVTGRVPA